MTDKQTGSVSSQDSFDSSSVETAESKDPTAAPLDKETENQPNGLGRTLIDNLKHPTPKFAAAVALVLATVIGGGTYWYTDYFVPHREATELFDTAVVGLEARNAELDSTILSLQDVLKSDEEPLDPSVAEKASATIGLAQGARDDIPEKPSDIEEIKTVAKQIERLGSYSNQLSELKTAQQALEESILQLKQVTNPSESFVIERLTGLPGITGVEAVTEGNDPNGNLGKAGGYTASIYFSFDQVDRSKLYLPGENTPIIDAGCDGGGNIEVYKTAEDAKKRNDYLSGFDGGILSSGSHRILGTCVVRTSNLLSASQQQTLEQSIVDSLTRIN